MPLTRSLFTWVRSLFAGRPRWIQFVLVVALVLFGWAFLLLSAVVTLIADGVGATGPGGRLHPLARVGIGVVVLFALVAALPNRPNRNETADLTPTVTPSSAATVSAMPSSNPTLVAMSASPEPPTASPSVTPIPSPTETAAVASAPTSASATDPAGDQLDENDEPVDGVDYQDIVAMTAEWRDPRLALSIDVAAAPPKVDPLVEVITFAWLLDTDTDGQPDWLLIVENVDEPPEENAPGWSVGLTRMSDGQTLAGREFPGTLLVDGPRVLLTTDLYARTDRVGIAATTEHTVWEGPLEATTIHDDLPQTQWPEGNDWLVIATD
jgi:hypothetical protein